MATEKPAETAFRGVGDWWDSPYKTLAEQAIDDVAKTLCLADMLDEQADRPHIGLLRVEAARVQTLRDKADRYRREAYANLGAIYHAQLEGRA